MKTKPNTAQAGAQAERDAVLAYVRRLHLRTPMPSGEFNVTGKIVAWLRERKKRYDARPGGLGRGKK